MQRVQDTQPSCIGQDMGPSSGLRSSEDCIVVSDSGFAAATGRNFEDYMSAAIDIGSSAMKQRTPREVRLRCCFGIRLVLAVQDPHIAAGCMWADQDTAVEARAAAVVEALVGIGILRSDLADIENMGLGSDWKEAAGSFRLGSKTLCRKCGCSRSSQERIR